MELKIIDLRVGNIIKDPLLPIKVTAKLLLAFEQNDGYINLYRGQELTESELLRFGFEDISGVYDDADKVFYKYGYYVRKETGKWYFGLGHQDFNTELKSVSHLQNLWYFFIGHELTPKEK